MTNQNSNGTHQGGHVYLGGFQKTRIIDTNMMKKIFLLTFFVLMTWMSGFAQSNMDLEMADLMRSSGKIYVVISVLLIILGGIAGYLFYLDKKLKHLEKKIQSKLNNL